MGEIKKKVVKDENEEDLKKCAEFLSRVYREEIVTNEEILDFCNFAVRIVSNDFSKYVKEVYGEEFVYPEIEFRTPPIEFRTPPDGETWAGFYTHSKNMISLNPECFSPENISFRITEFLEVLGHEFTHYCQFELADLSDSHEVNQEIREDAEIMKDIVNTQKTRPEQIGLISSRLKSLFGDAVFDQFSNMSLMEKQNRCKNLSFGSYLQLRHEEQAREGGFEFAKIFLDKLEPFMHDNKGVSILFNEDRNNFSGEHEEREQDYENYMSEYHQFKQSIMEGLQKIDKSRLQREERELKRLFYVETLTDDEEEYLMKLQREQSVLYETIQLLYQDCPQSQLLEDFLVYFSDESFSCVWGVFKAMQLRGCSEDFMKGIGETVVEYLKTQPFTNETCDFDFNGMLTKEQIDDVAKSLIEQGRLTLAFNLIKNDSNYRTLAAKNPSERANQQARYMEFLESYTKRIDETYEKFLNGEDVLLEEDFFAPERGRILGGIFSESLSEETMNKLGELSDYYNANKNSQEFIDKQNEMRKQVYKILPEKPMPEFLKNDGQTEQSTQEEQHIAETKSGDENPVNSEDDGATRKK